MNLPVGRDDGTRMRIDEEHVIVNRHYRYRTVSATRRDRNADMTGYDVTPPPERVADRVQLRTAFSTERGAVTRFMTQLEYWLDGGWRTVVRYDHDHAQPGGHDVTEEGLHRDVYRDGEKHHTETVAPPIPASQAFDHAEDDLRENAERFITRFETWHGVTDGANL